MSADVVPQAHHDNDGEMALAVNGKYAHRRITRGDLIAEAESWKVRESGPIIDAALETISAVVTQEVPDPRSYSELRSDIGGFCGNLIAGKAAGG